MSFYKEAFKRAIPLWSVLLLLSTPVLGKEMTIAVSVDLKPKDPVELELLDEWEVFAGVHDTLVQYDVNEGFTGILAEKWEFNPKEKTFIFRMRPQAKFSDGSPITAEDVAFSFRRVLYLDQDGSQILSRCLSGPKVKLRSPSEPHPGIRVPNATTLVLGPLQCGETLLNELANANYGVISRQSLDNQFKVKPTGPFSGLFTYSIENGDFVLKQNLQNWRWGAPSNKPPGKIRVVRFTPERFSSESSAAQLLRISDPAVYRRAQELGYHLRFSLPIMTWYMAPAKLDPSQQKWVKDVLSDINDRLDRKKLPYFSNNPLEHPSAEFFPEEFNCGSEVSGKPRPAKTLNRKSIYIDLIDHPSGESKGYSQQLADQLRSLGYSIGPAPKGNSRSLQLNLRRQFLGDSVVNVLLMMFRTLRSIPDPSREVIPHLERVERMEKAEQRQFLKTVCQKFHRFHHVPIAHRNYAFATRDNDLQAVFSKVTGNLVLEQFTKLKDRL